MLHSLQIVISPYKKDFGNRRKNVVYRAANNVYVHTDKANDDLQRKEGILKQSVAKRHGMSIGILQNVR